jgi:hypothetical protein
VVGSVKRQLKSMRIWPERSRIPTGTVPEIDASQPSIVPAVGAVARPEVTLASVPVLALYADGAPLQEFWNFCEKSHRLPQGVGASISCRERA